MTTVNTTSLHPPRKRLLGKGTFGEVYMTKDSLGHVSAVKIGSVDMVEIDTMVRICHPNIMYIKNIFRFEEETSPPDKAMQIEYGIGIQMPLVPYTLDTCRHPIPEKKRENLSFKLLCAFAFLHSAGIVHRDIKAANILIDGDYEPYVSDFGLAVPMWEEKDVYEALAFSGTLSTSGPEILSSFAVKQYPYNFSAVSDAWSIGLLLYNIWSGHRLYTYNPGKNAAQNLSSLLAINIAEKIASIAAPNMWKHVISGMLSIAPEARWTPEQALREINGGCLNRQRIYLLELPPPSANLPPIKKDVLSGIEHLVQGLTPITANKFPSIRGWLIVSRIVGKIADVGNDTVFIAIRIVKVLLRMQKRHDLLFENLFPHQTYKRQPVQEKVFEILSATRGALRERDLFDHFRIHKISDSEERLRMISIALEESRNPRRFATLDFFESR